MADPGAPADLSQYATQFDEIQVEERTNLLDLNAINPLSEFREVWEGATNTPTEHHLSTQADTDDTAYLRTKERGQYTAGYQTQGGAGVRVPSNPTGDSEIRWGYYEVDTNGDPLNGFYFGVDSEGIFVARANGGTVEKVHQDDWNRDCLNGGDGNSGPNPSGQTLDLADGHVFRIDFTYYGYGTAEFTIHLGSSNNEEAADARAVHVMDVAGDTSTKNTNLPLRQEIDSGGVNNDALDLFVGGRQFAIIGKETSNSRRGGHYRQSLGVVDDTKWYAAISVKVKDGTDIGSIDFSHMLAEIVSFEANPDATAYRYQVRRGTTPDAPTWVNPTSAENKQDETAYKVDVSSADVQDGSGNLTGVFLDGGNLDAGSKNQFTIKQNGLEGRIIGGEVVTLLFKAVPSASGTISDIFLKWEEKW